MHMTCKISNAASEMYVRLKAGVHNVIFAVEHLKLTNQERNFAGQHCMMGSIIHPAQ